MSARAIPAGDALDPSFLLNMHRICTKQKRIKSSESHPFPLYLYFCRLLPFQNHVVLFRHFFYVSIHTKSLVVDEFISSTKCIISMPIVVVVVRNCSPQSAYRLPSYSEESPSIRWRFVPYIVYIWERDGGVRGEAWLAPRVAIDKGDANKDRS